MNGLERRIQEDAVKKARRYLAGQNCGGAVKTTRRAVGLIDASKKGVEYLGRLLRKFHLIQAELQDFGELTIANSAILVRFVSKNRG